MKDDTLFDAYRNMADTFLDHARAEREDQAWRTFVEYWNGKGAWGMMSERAYIEC